MCGISGIINFNGQKVHEHELKTMIQKMKHRGPDDDGIFIDNNIGFGFVRLSILDLSISGHQPMVDPTGNFTIIFNGEIYNYIELKEELKAKGYVFHSGTDTEVLLYLYMEYKDACLEKLNGMFAFAIYNKQAQNLFIARDHFGIKPFYYYLDRNRMVFASEIPPILSVLSEKPEPDMQIIFDYLAFNRTDQTDLTFFRGIRKLQHGKCWLVDISGKETNSIEKIKRWYNLNEKVKNTVGFKSPQEYKEMFSSALGLQLRSDVPVGVTLSGGLDSSSIVSVLLKDFNKFDLHTFSAVYGRGLEGDESEYIAEFNPLLHHMNYVTPTGETLFADKEDFIRAHAEPLPSVRPYAQFKVMEIAKNDVVVTLDGQGADEQLAGYHYFFGFYFKELLRKFNFYRLLTETRAYHKIHNSTYGLKSFIYLLLPEKLQVEARIIEHGYINRDFLNEYGPKNFVTRNIYASNTLNKAFLDHFEFKLEHLLKWEDINSMWFSLESRVPFLDYRLVEKTLALKPDQIIKNGVNKYIMRQALKGILPEKIRNRMDKIGFDNPADDWFRTIQFQRFLEDIFENGYFFKNKIMNSDKARQRYQQHLNHKANIHVEIWKWINLNLWYDMFFR
ncbi:MAG: asparagine synthase (glutamine-hydrolyzing) [Bacteroidales bacterium]